MVPPVEFLIESGVKFLTDVDEMYIYMYPKEENILFWIKKEKILEF